MTNRMPPPQRRPLTPSQDRTWASVAHFGNVLGILPSLLVFLILGGRGPLVHRESREALNLSLTALIAALAVYLVGTVSNTLYGSMPAGFAVPFLILGLLCTLAMFAVWILVIVLSIIAGVRVNQGDASRYPFALRIVK